MPANDPAVRRMGRAAVATDDLDSELERLLTGRQPARRVEAEPRTHVRATGKPYAVGIALAVFGILLWLPAAGTTVDGWPMLVNIVLSFFHIDPVVPLADGWTRLALAIIVGYLYSRVEFRLPIWYDGQKWIVQPFEHWLGWLLIMATDVGTTYLGISTVREGAWLIQEQVAAVPALAATAALIFTIAPDRMIRAGWRLLRLPWLPW